jgi:hypothetical protein
LGEDRLVRCINLLSDMPAEGVRADLRRLSRMFKSECGRRMRDDATLFMVEWRGGAANHLAVLD